MKEQLKQLTIAAFDKIAGPVLDEFGSAWVAKNPTEWVIKDRKTKEVIGNSQMIAGDGIVYLTSFDKPTQLRRETKAKVAKKLGIK